jgi:hypothetical protein
MNSLVSANVKVSGGLRAAFACPSPPPEELHPPPNPLGHIKLRALLSFFLSCLRVVAVCMHSGPAHV